ncbi:MAG TPA: J domain-containing protein [Ignavibacteriaceae bacterium]|nr:J domain-containing protein [Ignavibacteriaceae bacterium]
MDFKDYYKVLGVDKKASDDEIRKVYRKLAKQYHPDKNPGDKKAEERFKEISEAYNVLGDKEKRKKYDELADNWQYYGNQGAGGQPQADWFKNYQNSGQGSSFNFSGNFSDFFSGSGGFADFFEQFMGGSSSTSSSRKGGRRTTYQSAPAQDLEAELPLTLNDVFHGTEKQLNVDGRKINIKIQPGLESGKKLKLRNQGRNNGSLFLKIKIAEHPIFERKENDLYADVNVDMFTAALGGKASFTTIDNKTINLNIAPGTDSGTLLRVKGMGMPAYNNNSNRGDLFLKVKIISPKHLSEDEKELLKKMAEKRK